jgi:hypothetical protein
LVPEGCRSLTRLVPLLLESGPADPSSGLIGLNLELVDLFRRAAAVGVHDEQNEGRGIENEIAIRVPSGAQKKPPSGRPEQQSAWKRRVGSELSAR